MKKISFCVGHAFLTRGFRVLSIPLYAVATLLSALPLTASADDNGRKTTRGDFDYNGLSDVVYIKKDADSWTALEYGLDGVNDLEEHEPLSPSFRIIGVRDMNRDYRSDVVVCSIFESDSSKDIEIGYGKSGEMDDWHVIGHLGTPNNVEWDIHCGNLSGEKGRNSILWHAPAIGALGYWPDGKGVDSWVSIPGNYDKNWKVLGLGNFSEPQRTPGGVKKTRDSVLFLYGGNNVGYVTPDDGKYTSLGYLDKGWGIAAIADFSNKGCDDLILFNPETRQVGKWENGRAENWKSLGTVEAGDIVEGAGDYDGDGWMDLLIRKADGTMGYCPKADLSKFVSFGYKKDASWTVIPRAPLAVRSAQATVLSAAQAQSAVEKPAPTDTPASQVVEPGVIVLKGQINGSGTFVFRKDSVMFRKTGFHDPTGVTVNGEVWSNMTRPFRLDGASAFVPVRIRTMEEHYITAVLSPAGDEAELKLSSASGRTGSFRIELAGPKTDTKGGPIELEGIFNGIGTFEFNGSRIIYHHIAFQPPREVTVNGRSWPITRGKGVYWMTSGGGDRNPDFELDFVPDFHSMKLAGETGLQKLTLTPSGNGMELYLSDLRQNPERTRIRIEAGSRPAPDANQAEVTIQATGGKGSFSFRDNMVVFEPAARNPLTFPKNVTVNDRSWSDLSMPFRLDFRPGFGKAEILESTGPGFVRTEKKPDNVEFVFDNSNVWGSDPTRFTVLVEKNSVPAAPKSRHTAEIRAELDGTAAAFKFEGSRIICYPLNDKPAKNVTVNGKPWSDLDKPFELGFEIDPLRAQITNKQGACTVEQLKYPDSYVLRLDGQGSGSCRVVAELDDGTTAAAGSSNKQKTLSFEMKFDGVGRLTFRDNGIYFKLFRGNYPYNVTVNGRPWDDLDQPFALDFVPDFASATIADIKMGAAAELTPGADHADLLLNTNGSLRDCQLDLTMKKRKDANPESAPAAGAKTQTPVTRYAGFTGVGPFRPDAAADLGDPRDTAVFEVMTDKPCMFTFQDDTILCGIPEPPTPTPQGYNPPMISVNGRLLNDLGKPILLDFIPDLAHAEVTVSFERRSQITRIADTPVLIRRDGNKMVVRTLDMETGNRNESGSYSVRIKMKKLGDSGRDPDVGERMTMNDPKRLMPAGQTQNWGAMMQSIVDAMEGTRLRALDFEAEVAGTGVFEFFGDRIRYLHESGERPSGVTIGGIPWDDLNEPFELPFVVDNYHETLSYRYAADSPLADYPYKPVSLLSDRGRQYLATRTVAATDGGTPCRYHVHYEMTELNQKKAGRGRASTSATSSLGGLPASGVAPTLPVPEFETVVLEGVLNGRGSFVIQGNTIVHNNTTGREPVRMTVNGKPWDDVKKPFELDFTPDYSSRAKLVGTRGRIAPLLSSLSQRVEVSYNDSGAYGDLYRVVFTVQKKSDGK